MTADEAKEAINHSFTSLIVAATRCGVDHYDLAQLIGIADDFREKHGQMWAVTIDGLIDRMMTDGLASVSLVEIQNYTSDFQDEVDKVFE